MVTTTADDHVGAVATVIELAAMSFAHRLAATRKQRGLTQQHLADAIGVHLSQVRRYEAASSQPTLDVLKRLAVALTVTIDDLAFGETERGPGEGLRLHLEAASRLDPEEQAVLRSVIEGLTLKHEARRWDVTPDRVTASPANASDRRV